MDLRDMLGLANLGVAAIDLGKKLTGGSGVTGQGRDIEKEELKELSVNQIQEVVGSPARIVNRELALSTPCKRVKIGKKTVAFSKGAIGFLGPLEQGEFCKLGFEDLKGPGVERLQRLQGAIQRCGAISKQEAPGFRLEPFFMCMCRELGFATASKKGGRK